MQFFFGRFKKKETKIISNPIEQPAFSQYARTKDKIFRLIRLYQDFFPPWNDNGEKSLQEINDLKKIIPEEFIKCNSEEQNKLYWIIDHYLRNTPSKGTTTFDFSMAMTSEIDSLLKTLAQYQIKSADILANKAFK